MTDVTITRLQNRRGRKVDLPQPLRPGEIGLCEDTQEVFIGRDASEANISSINVFKSMYYSTVENYLNNNILTVSSTAPTVEMTKSQLDALKTAIIPITATVAGVSSPVTINDGSGDTDNSGVIIEQVNLETNVSLPANYVLYVFVKPTYPPIDHFPNSVDLVEVYDLKQQLLDALMVNVAAVLTTNPSIATVTIGTGLTVNTVTGAVLTPSHDIANAIASCINFSANEGIVTSNLNLQIITGDVSLTGGTPNDFLANPMAIELAPSPAVFTPILELSYDYDNSDALFIDYTVSHKSGISEYSSVGKLTVTVNALANTANIVDETNEVAHSTGGNIYFNAVYNSGGNTVSVSYSHNFPASVTLKVMTKRWSKF